MFTNLGGFLLTLLLAFTSVKVLALEILTSTETLAGIVNEIKSSSDSVSFLARGVEDAHYLEAKPSFMTRVRQADLVILVGLDLESAWLTNVLRGGRNPKVLPGQSGYLDVSEFIEAIEIQTGPLDRSLGDVHPLGNPHYYLDPVRVKQIIPKLVERLSLLSESNKDIYKNNGAQFIKKLEAKLPLWTIELNNTKVKTVITYHRTLNYFLRRFGLTSVDTLEPKPGIPPTANHLIVLGQKAKKNAFDCILNESHFEISAAKKLSQMAKVNYAIVPTEIGATETAKDYVTLINEIVNQIKSCTKKG
jgi:zinc/manganese transport system substrate-binding protein